MHNHAHCQDVLYSWQGPFVILQQLQCGVQQFTFLLLFLLLQQQHALLQLLEI